MTINKLSYRAARDHLHRTIKRVEGVNTNAGHVVIAAPDGSVLSRTTGTFTFDLSDALTATPEIEAHTGTVTVLSEAMKQAVLVKLNSEDNAMKTVMGLNP